MSTEIIVPQPGAAIRNQLFERRALLRSALSDRAAPDYLSGLLDEVDGALARFATGTFGLCEVCHETIEADRLASNPLLRMCLDHLTYAERRALEEDLSMSAHIQAALLPPADLHHAGWETAYHYQPAGVVSGDYCDLVPGPGELFFLVGDVSGKGVAASILMAHLHAMFRSLITVGLPLKGLMERANRMLCDSTMPNSYATLVCGRAAASGEVETVNAGHCAPLVKRPDSIHSLESGGLPLGLFCDSRYTAETISLDPGDRLVLYTDGLSEARDASGAEYGAGRIPHLLDGPAGARPSVEALVRGLSAFRGGTAQHDDLTVMALRRAA